jgi:hypothetical protein
VLVARDLVAGAYRFGRGAHKKEGMDRIYPLVGRCCRRYDSLRERYRTKLTGHGRLCRVKHVVCSSQTAGVDFGVGVGGRRLPSQAVYLDF